MKAALYIRVSTDEQAKHGYSIAAQQERLEAFCISQGWEIKSVFIDDGYSAKDLIRPKFTQMMNEVKKGKLDVLLVYRLDRLTRSVVDLYTIMNILDEHNCKFKSATEVYDTTNAMGRLFITLVAAIAQWERENTAERVRIGMEKKTKLGKWKGGTAPYGYEVINKELIINEKEKQVVEEIYELSKTYGFYTIAKRLTTKGIATRKGGDWHVDTVRDIANNPVYAGYLTFSENTKEYKKPPREKTLFEGNHQRIIPREEYWELQETLDKRRVFGGKRQTSNYYFSSILKCARCGSSMSGHKGSKGVKTYRCSGKKAGKSCSSHIITETNLEKKIIESFDGLVEKAIGSTVVNDYPIEKIKEIEIQLKDTQRLLKKQKTMFENDIIDIDELISKTEKLRKQEKKLLIEIQNYKSSQKNNLDEIHFISENISQLWIDANEYEKKQLISLIFKQIVIDTKDEYRKGSGIPREIIIVSVK